MFAKQDKPKARGTHAPTHGLDSTSRMRTAISPGQWLGQWQPDSLGLINMAWHSFKRQLHTTHVGVVSWEPCGSSPTPCTGRRIRGYPDLCANKGETAVHGCHCPSDMAVRMREVLARPWIGICVPLALSLSSCKTSHYRKVHKSYLLILHFFLSHRLRSHATG